MLKLYTVLSALTSTQIIFLLVEKLIKKTINVLATAPQYFYVNLYYSYSIFHMSTSYLKNALLAAFNSHSSKLMHYFYNLKIKFIPRTFLGSCRNF